jgi:hypothetical protein
LQAGDPNPTHNLPKRPLLDTPLAILAGLGLIGAWFSIRRKWLVLWWLGWVVVSFVPTILSTATPHYLRGLGVLVPLALLIGAGGAFLTDLDFARHSGIARYAPTKIISAVTITLILWAGVNTYRDFETWLAHFTPNIYIDDRFNAAMQIVREQTPPDMPMMIPGIIYHPVAAFHGYGMPQREFFFYDWPDGDCYVTPRRAYVAVDLPIYLNRFEQRVQPYSASVETIFRHPEQEYNVFIVTPQQELIADWDNRALLGDGVEIHAVQPLLESVSPGETLTFFLAMRVHQTPTQAYRFFVHLQNEPTPYEGGTQWATGDAPLCAQVYNPVWDTEKLSCKR